MRRRRRSERGMRVAMAMVWIVPISFFGVGAWGLNETLLELPHDYSILEERGVRRPAVFLGCTRHKDRDCRLRLAGQEPWTYPINGPQFRGLSPGDPVEVLVDPRNPSRRYTAADVRMRTHEGIGGLFAFSVAMVLGGIVATGYMRRATRHVV